MKKFIALVLSLVMALSLCAPAWGAEPVEVTSLDGLQDAIADGETEIKLTTNEIVITTDTTIESDVAVTIDVSAVEDAFTVTSGTLTLGKNVTVKSDANKKWGVLWANGGAIVIDGATVTSANDAAVAYVQDGGSLTIESGVISNTGADSDNDGKGPCAIGVTGAASVVNVNGGTVSSATNSAIYVKDTGGIVNISGGTVSTDAVNPAFVTVYGYAGEINVSGGVIEANAAPSALVSCGNNITVSGGTVEGVMAHESANAEATITGGNITGAVSKGNVGTVSVSGGTFATDVSAFVEGDIAAAMVDDKCIVGADDIVAAATAGTKVTVLKGEVTLGDKVLDENSGEYTVPDSKPNPKPNPKPNTNPSVNTTPNEGMTSPDTFDAGIALYVGVSVMGAIGSVVLSKKRED